MKQQDFIFTRKDEAFEDYWFQVTGKSAETLTERYMEMCMVAVTDVVYSAKEDKLGIRRQFPFNYDVICPNDDELKQVLLALIQEIK